MAYNNNNHHQNPYYVNYNYNNYNNYNNGTSYDDQIVPSTSSSSNDRVQELNQKYLSKINTGANNSTRSLDGTTVIETPRVNPTENAEVGSINSSLYSQHNRQDQQPYGQPVDEGESRLASAFTKKDNTAALGEMKDQYHNYNNYNYNYNYNNGYLSPYNNYNRHNDYYDEEATRHNTLTDDYRFEDDYTDRDFPGGGKGARQSITGEQLAIPEKEKKRRRCCCCSLTVCILITVIILVGLGITGFFVIPRVPKVDVRDAIPSSASPPQISLNPPFVKMDFNIIVAIGNEKNYVSYRFNKIDVAVFDAKANSDKPIATGAKTDYILRPKSNDTFEFPLSVDYSAKDQNDSILQDFINSCSPSAEATLLKLKVDVVLYIWGIDWIYKPKISVPVPDMKCPINSINL